MNDIHAVGKGIKTNRIDYQKISDPINISKILEVVSKLLILQNVQTAKINELKLDSNPLRWITSLIKADLKKYVEAILNTYCLVLPIDSKRECEATFLLVFHSSLFLNSSTKGSYAWRIGSSANSPLVTTSL